MDSNDNHTENLLIKTEKFKSNFALNTLTSSYTAMSYLKSDLFRASLISCKEFRIISNRVREESEEAGALFFRWIFDEIIFN